MPSDDIIRHHYDRWSATYDSAPNPTRDLNARVLREELAGRIWRRVLEIGCGTGINTEWLLERADEVVATDFSEGMLDVARHRLAGRPVQFVRADVTEPWPLGPGFDLVVGTLVLEHVADVGHVFAEAYRVLLPGGTLYLAELHPYRQLRGSQARYAGAEGGQEVRVPAFRHTVSEFVNGGIGAGFLLRRLGEWTGEEDDAPRLLTVSFER
jgi:ubiquinone/menaquinone biosynthesis C-methylase UbiE